MRSLIILFAILALASCKEKRHPRMAQTHREGDTLVVDGPAIIASINYIKKNALQGDTTIKVDEYIELFKFAKQFAEKDSVLTINADVAVIKSTDYFGEFPDQIVNLLDYRTPIVFLYPGREAIVMEDWSKNAIAYAHQGDIAKMEELLLEKKRDAMAVQDSLMRDQWFQEKVKAEQEDDARKNEKMERLKSKDTPTHERMDIGKK